MGKVARRKLRFVAVVLIGISILIAQPSMALAARKPKPTSTPSPTPVYQTTATPQASQTPGVTPTAESIPTPLITPTPENTALPTNTPSYKVIGYLAGWSSWSAATVKYSQMTHINYAFANCVNSKVTLGSSSDTLKFAELNKMKQANPSLKTLISVGGWTWSAGFHDAALTDASRTVFADSTVSFIKSYGFDGIDIDWEYPGQPGAGNPYGPEDKHNFTLLLQKVREKLDAAGAADGKDYLLTIAGGAGSSYAQNTELGLIAGTLDYINVMTYDFSGSWTSTTAHHTNLYKSSVSSNWGISADTAINMYIQNGVPVNKLVMGIAFYGYGFSGVSSSTNNGLGQTYSGSVATYTYNQLAGSYISKNGYVRYWDDSAKAPYLYNSTQRVCITYEDTQSIGYKSSYVKLKSLAGAMFWEYSQDTSTTLLNKLYTDLR